MIWNRLVDLRTFRFNRMLPSWWLIVIFIVALAPTIVPAGAQESPPQIYGIPPVPGIKLSDLDAWVGYEPDFLDSGTDKEGADITSALPINRQIWANSELHAYLTRLLGQSNYDVVVNQFTETSVVERVGTWLEISRCMPHDCPDSAVVFINPKNNDVKVYLANFNNSTANSVEWIDDGIDEKASPSMALKGWDLTDGSDPATSFELTAEDYLKSNPGLLGAGFQTWIDAQMSAIESNVSTDSISTCGQLLSYGGNLTGDQIIDIKNEIAQALQYVNGLAQAQGLPMLSDKNYQSVFFTINNTIPNSFVKNPDLDSQLFSDVESFCSTPGLQGADIQKIVATDYNTIREMANMPPVALGF